MCSDIQSGKNAYINCEDCPKIFFTKRGLKLHSRSNQHQTRLTKVDHQLEELATHNDEIAPQENSKFVQEERRDFCSKIDLQLQTSNENNKLTSYQFTDCKKLCTYTTSSKKYIQNENGIFFCRDCKISFRHKSSLQGHILNVHKKFTQYKCVIEY